MERQNKRQNYARAVKRLREAFSHGIIQEEQAWMEILNDRNLTAHIYQETTANEIFQRICSRHILYFEKLEAFFQQS